MHLPHYPTESSAQLDYFEFISHGRKGPIRKSIRYQALREGMYNLSFGEKIDRGVNFGRRRFSIDDNIVSDNGDRDMVLATVGITLYKFTDEYPDRRVYFAGSSPARTRLYRMAISRYIEELSENFYIFGLIEDPLTEKRITHSFCKGEDYIGFIVHRK